MDNDFSQAAIQMGSYADLQTTAKPLVVQGDNYGQAPKAPTAPVKRAQMTYVSGDSQPRAQMS